MKNSNKINSKKTMIDNNRVGLPCKKILVFSLLFLSVLTSQLESRAFENAISEYPPNEILVLFEVDENQDSYSETETLFKNSLQNSLSGKNLVVEKTYCNFNVAHNPEKSFGSTGETKKKIISKIVSKDSRTISEMIDLVSQQKGFLGASPNYAFQLFANPNDPGYSEQWGLKAIDAPETWDICTGDSSVFVAVLDTGIDFNHSDLVSNIGRDSNGQRGFNAISSGEPMDDHNHGTHVAGIIGAIGNNNNGVAGINWSVSLLSVKVLNGDGSGSLDGIISGLNYILGQKQSGVNIKAINASLGAWISEIKDISSDPFAVACKAISDNEIILVSAAGNEETDLDNPEVIPDPLFGWRDVRGMRVYPACFQFDNMIAVAAMDSDGSMSSFSNYSPNYVHIGAPGRSILSSIIGNDYKEFSGTSMAAPHVTGAVALLFAKNPTEDASAVKNRLLTNCDLNQFFTGKVYSDGTLNLYSAITGNSTPGIKPVTGIVLSHSSLDLKRGESFLLSAKIQPLNAGNKNVSWVSESNAVATVDQTGGVTAVGPGSTTIVATTEDGGFQARCVVSVPSVPVSGVSLSLTSLTLGKGDFMRLVADIRPSEATNRSVSWWSSNPGVAIVDDGNVLAIANGRTEITAVTQDGGYRASCSVYVEGEGFIGMAAGCSVIPGKKTFLSLLLLLPGLALVFKPKG